MNNIKYLKEKRDSLLCVRNGLFCRILDKEIIIFDLNKELQDDNEFKLWKKKKLQTYGKLAKERLEYGQQIKLELILESLDYKFDIVI